MIKKSVSIFDIKRLAEGRLKDAREKDNHVRMGLVQVPEDRLWEFFLLEFERLAETARRQSGG